MRIWSAWYLLVLGLGGSAVRAAAPPQPSEPPQPVITESIDVRVVNVETVVTDWKGHRVRGLTAADFRLLVDGREVPIDYFTEVADGASTAAPASSSAPAATAPEAPAPPVQAPAPVSPVQGVVGRSILVFVDQEMSVKTQLEQVLRGLGKQLGRLGPEDQVAVVAYWRGKLTVLSDWTGDRAAVHAALDRAARLPSDGLATVRAEQDSLRQDNELQRVLVQVGGGSKGAAASPSHSLYSLAQVHKTMAATVAALRGFAGGPGRKMALLLAGGWPVDEPKLFLSLIDTANRLGYTLYPVDVPGIESSALPDDIGDQSQFDPGSPREGFITSDWENAAQGSLESLARSTGGKAMLNSSRIDALDRLVADTGTYYWIGFSPTWRGDGRRHGVRLEVRRPGLAVRARHDFIDLPRAVESAQALDSALLLGFDPEGKIAEGKKLVVQLGKARLAGSRSVEILLTLAVPTEALSFVASGEGYRAELTAHVVLFDGADDPQEMPPMVLRVAVREVPPPGQLARFQATVRLRRDTRRMRISTPDTLHDKLLWGEVVLGKL
jgi:VWFA-related protein